MAREQLSHTIEDYLKTIHDLTLTGERATTNQIAERMEVTPASVTGMLQRLAALEPPLLEYRKHYGVELTPEGEQIALELIRHHRLLELFLYERLGFSWDEVHEEADRLEHVISENFEERMAEVLGDPLHDPHGHPIPDRDLVMPPQTAVPLSSLRPGETAIVQRVADDDPKLLRHLHTIGLIPGVSLSVVEYSPFDDNLSLSIEGQDERLVLGSKVTRQIYVQIG